MQDSLGCISHYEVHDAYAKIGVAASPEVVEAVDLAKRRVYFDDPLRISAPYSFFRKKMVCPPDNASMRFLAIVGIILLYASMIGYHFYLLHRQEGRNPASTSAVPTPHVALTSSMEVCQECSDTSQSFGSDGIPFVIDNSATCIICNYRSQLVGPLRVQHTSVKTPHGTASSVYAGTIAIRLTRNAGQTFEYHVPNAIYDPNSPFNILGIPFLGDYFGAKDTVPNRDDDGTHVKSSASKTTFVWDHGQHSRDFTHDARSLPVLTLDTGAGYFQAFCTRRVCRRYEDTVHFAFSSAHSIIPDETTTPLHSRADFVPVTTDTEFTLGQDVMYTDGKGLQAKMVNEGATPDGLWHTLRLDNGSKVVTPPSHVHFLDQPDFSNIPSTLLDYSNEVGIGISKEDTQELAYPCILSPSQQILLSWHHRLYHLPFARLFQLVRWKILPRSILGCEAKPPLCIACQFGQAHYHPLHVKNKVGGSIWQNSIW